MSRRRAKPKPIRRPFSTHYYRGAGDREPEAVSHGACASEEGAIRATVVRVFMGQYQKAIIHDRRTGVAIYNVRQGPGGIQVRYGSGIDFKTWDEKQRRKA